MGLMRTSYNSRPKAGVYAYLTSSATTTVTTGDTFVPIEGTFGNDPLEAFVGTTVGGKPAIQYVGDTCVFQINWYASLSSQDSGRTVHVGISHNGEVLNPATSSGSMGVYCKTAAEVFALSGTRVVTLSYGDTIQLMVTSDTDADQVTFEHFTTTIRRFFRS